MISANEARKLTEADSQTKLNNYVERVYGPEIQKIASEGSAAYLRVYERRPIEAVRIIADYLKEYGYRVTIQEVASPVWSVEVYW